MMPAVIQMRRAYTPLYAAIFALLLLSWFNPKLPLSPRSLDLMLLLDESSSINRNYNQQVWKNFITLSRTLPAGSRISLLRFADKPTLELPWAEVGSEKFKQLDQQSVTRHRAIIATSSNIADAITSALRYLSPRRQSAILISSDGFETDPQAQPPLLPINDNPRLELFYQPAGAAAQSHVYIESVNLYRAAKQLDLSLALKADKKISVTLEVRALNKILLQQDVSFPKAGLRVLYPIFFVAPQNNSILTLIVRDDQQNILARQVQAIPMPRKHKLLYISRTNQPMQKQSLLPDGWKMTMLKPSQIPPQRDFLQPFDVVILDDISTSELSPMFTNALQQHIRNNAGGLIVAGGKHSFSADTYRHSRLESLLPVLSEPAKPRSAAAFAFVLDKSGSMEADSGQASRLDYALTAVIDSSKSLLPGDQSALIVFDHDVNILLPLKNRPDPTGAFDRRWPIRANGATRLVNALQRSAELLAQSISDQRFLIIVTDGIFNDDNLAATEQLLAQHQIKLVALVIGENNDLEQLKNLTESSGGSLLRVNDSARLSFYMRSQLNHIRSGWQQKSTIPQSTSPLPGDNENIRTWQQLSAYALTRARDSAQIYVVSEDGDPLLASANAEAGRVMALPGGWLKTSQGESILPLLLDQVSSHGRNPQISIHSRYQKGKLTITVDALTNDNEWRNKTVYIRGLNGATPQRDTAMQLVSAGRFQAQFDLPAASDTTLYRFLLNLDGRHLLYQTVLDSQQEQKIHTKPKWLEQALEQKVIKKLGTRYLNDQNLKKFLNSSNNGVALRQLWLTLAMLVYIFLMLYERSVRLPIFNLFEKHRHGKNQHE
jgi:hypothetical protein